MRVANELMLPVSQTARTVPSAPPRRARSRLSVSSCRTSRERPAPSASRTPISRRRAAPRPSKSPAIFAQPTSSTMPAMIVNSPMNAKSGASVRVTPRNPATPSIRKTSVCPKRSLSSGYSRASCRATIRVAACACAALTPGLSLAAIWNATLPRSCIMLPIFGRSIGIQKSEKKPAGRAPRNPRGITPSTSNGRPLSITVRPTIEGSLANRVRQVRSPSTTMSVRASEGR